MCIIHKVSLFFFPNQIKRVGIKNQMAKSKENNNTIQIYIQVCQSNFGLNIIR